MKPEKPKFKIHIIDEFTPISDEVYEAIKKAYDSKPSTLFQRILMKLARLLHFFSKNSFDILQLCLIASWTMFAVNFFIVEHFIIIIVWKAIIVIWVLAIAFYILDVILVRKSTSIISIFKSLLNPSRMSRYKSHKRS